MDYYMGEHLLLWFSLIFFSRTSAVPKSRDRREHNRKSHFIN